MPWASHPHAASDDPALDVVTAILDPVLVPLRFAPGQAGAARGCGQVIFCRGYPASADGGCVDLVLDLEQEPDWRLVDVRYSGSPAVEHLPFDRNARLLDQLSALARSLPARFG